MNTKEQHELIRLLNIFFDEFILNKRNATSTNQIAALLKKRLAEIGRWKNLPRGKHQYRPKTPREILRVHAAKTKTTKQIAVSSDDPPW